MLVYIAAPTKDTWLKRVDYVHTLFGLLLHGSGWQCKLLVSKDQKVLEFKSVRYKFRIHDAKTCHPEVKKLVLSRQT